MARQKKKDWKPSHDRDKLKCALRQKLVDIRPKLRKRFESVGGTESASHGNGEEGSGKELF